MPKGWEVELGWLAGLVFLALIVGKMSGDVVAPLLAALIPYLAWHLFHLSRLFFVLRGGEKLKPPFPPGLWRAAFNEIQALQAGRSKRKRQLLGYLSRFQEAVTALPEAVVILGNEWHIEWCNPAGAQLLGISWPATAGWGLTRVVRHPVLEEYLEKADFSRPLELPSPVSKTIILSLYITPFGRKHQHMLIARDITRVYLLDQARRDFVANVSHELRTPLTVISGFVETLAEDSGECPHQARSLELMQHHSARMHNLINDLLTLSRLEMGREPEMEAPIAVADLLGPIIDEARALSGGARHELSVEADPGLRIKGDPKELYSVFSNLVFNAVRHTPPRCGIQVTWGTDGEGARFTVGDTGEGIAARHIPRLTERFYRVDRGRSRGSGGTGLGLAIVKHVLQRYGGELGIESEEGRGSTFSCRFPPSALLRDISSVKTS